MRPLRSNSARRRGSINEQAAMGDYTLARPQAIQYLDESVISSTYLYRPHDDRIVRLHDPNMG
jgi:hypothetical protein